MKEKSKFLQVNYLIRKEKGFTIVLILELNHFYLRQSSTVVLVGHRFSEALPGAFKTKIDYSFGIRRMEYRCSNNGVHHRHVFLDNPTATGQKFCNNGLRLLFVPEN